VPVIIRDLSSDRVFFLLYLPIASSGRGRCICLSPYFPCSFPGTRTSWDTFPLLFPNTACSPLHPRPLPPRFWLSFVTSRCLRTINFHVGLMATSPCFLEPFFLVLMMKSPGEASSPSFLASAEDTVAPTVHQYQRCGRGHFLGYALSCPFSDPPL